MNQLIRCKNCDDLFMKTPFDQLPEYEWDPHHTPENFRSLARDDFQDFLNHHQGHQLEHLKIIEDSFASEKPYSEPLKTSFFKATNGKEIFVIKKFREKIDEPLKYQLVSGDFSLKLAGIEIQAEEISRQLKKEMIPPLSQTQIDAFLKLYHHLVKTINIQECTRVQDEASHPLEVYYAINEVHLMYLLRNCHHIFKGEQYLAIEAFIYRHKDDGVLLLKASFNIHLTETAKKKKVASPSLPLKKEKIIEKK
ncbi:MAG: hypothetical protein HXY44_00815 [Syntrophaceae bacterium]|nr:hypothetical protein [Syntrophaceae bacterium]